MFVENVSIKNYRSIEELRLPRCGRLNVFIGQNNAGKSNILHAIHTVFQCIRGGRVVAPAVNVANELNYFNKHTSSSVEISLEFSLALAERDSLLRDIASEAPHVKNALDGLDPSLRLAITFTITPAPAAFAIVSGISLARVLDNKSDAERVILAIGEAAARELNANAARSLQLVKDAKTLRNLPEHLPSAAFRRTHEGGREAFKIGDYLRHYAAGELSLSSSQRLDEMAQDASESEDIRPTIRNLAVKLEQEATDLQHQELKNTITTFSGEETSIPKYVQTLLERIGGIGVLYLQERRKAIGKEEAQRLLELKMSRGGPQVLRRIQETVGAMLGVQIDAFRGDSRNPRSESEAELDVGDFLVQANGSGIRESLRLILDNEFEHPSLLLIEEPEVHLHPALEASMMRYLQSISTVCQVFLTTHSTNFLDTAELTNVYLITKSYSTKAELLDIDSAETLLPRELGLRMSSLFMYDRLVFVEGRTDEAIIREWASLLNVNLSQANVGFVPMGGARNFSHYAAAATLAFLSKRNVESWILLDRDEKEVGEIDRLKAIATKFATVKVLEHREIENLLLEPRVILELIKFKQKSAAKSENEVTQDQVETALEQALNGLKKKTIHKRITKTLCTPLFPNREVHDIGDNESTKEKLLAELDRMISAMEATKAKFDDTEKAKTDYVEANWDSRKTQLVPGELVLDHVLRSYGLRFSKDHDGPRMASMMREDEIDPAMKAFIRELGAN